MNRVPRWRIVAAVAALVALLFFGAVLAPIYLRNLKLASFVATLPQSAGNGASPAASVTDAQVREWVVEKARALDLPVRPGDIAIVRSPADGRVASVSVHYMVRVNLPGYTVDLHFHPSAGSP